MTAVGNMVQPGAMSPPTEVKPTKPRRTFSAKEKKRILDGVAACTALGEVGALLRREGLYSSHLTKWRAQAERAALAALAAQKRVPTAAVVDSRAGQVAELEKALAKMTRRAERAEALVALQKKLSELLGLALPTAEETI